MTEIKNFQWVDFPIKSQLSFKQQYLQYKE